MREWPLPGRRRGLRHSTIVTGAEFRHRVEVIVEAFTDLQADQHDERRAAERRWARREKQLQRVIASTAGMYGNLQGLIGPSMDTMPLLNGVPDQTMVAPIRAGICLSLWERIGESHFSLTCSARWRSGQ